MTDDPKPVTVHLGPSSEDMRPDDYVFLQGDHTKLGKLTLTSVHADMLEPEPAAPPRNDAPGAADVTLATPEEVTAFRAGLVVIDVVDYPEPSPTEKAEQLAAFNANLRRLYSDSE
jgi:hypothetical protein